MSTETRYYIAAMDCPTEEQIIRNGLKGMKGVEGLDFDLLNRILTVRHALADDVPVAARLKSIGMEPRPAEEARPGEACGGCDHAHDHAARDAARARRSNVLLGLSGAAAAVAEIVAWRLGPDGDRAWPVIALALGAIALGGRETLRKGWNALKTRTLNINFLMSVAVAGALAVGQWPEAAMVTFLFALAEKIEGYSLERARNAIQALMAVAPPTAWVPRGAGWESVPAEQVAVETRVQVRPGERIPLDGVVVEGQSAVDQAAVTGESLPVAKQPGDMVFAGTINERGTFVFRVTGSRGNTVLDRILKTVQEAQAQRAPTQRFVDRFAALYTPIVCGLALLVATLPPLVTGQPLLLWVYRALVLLVIACPCALVISTPVTVVSGLTAAARRGILIKGGVFLEQGRKLKVVALDKTGTLTQGRPRVTDIVPLGDQTPEQVLHLAASLNAPSEHPVASAIVTACSEAHVCQPLPVAEFQALIGRGVTGRLSGDRYYIGNHRLTEENRVCGPHVEQILERLEAEGKTPVVLTSDEQALAVLGVADTPRAASIEAIRALGKLGIQTVMLTGDTQKTADAIARQVGLTEARGDLLPEDKLAAIEALLARHGAVGMVGDGINDAPALAKATLGFAMGGAGTDVAIETADVALMDDDLRKLPQFVRLSRAVGSVLVQNIALAIGIKLVFFSLALVGRANLWMAVFADVGASLLVTANGLRLLRFR